MFRATTFAAKMRHKVTKKRIDIDASSLAWSTCPAPKFDPRSQRMLVAMHVDLLHHKCTFPLMNKKKLYSQGAAPERPL